MVSWAITVMVGLLWFQQQGADSVGDVVSPPRSHSGVQRELEGEKGKKSPQSLVVDVKGAVRRPGVYSLSVGSRVYDALRVAGGLEEFADPLAINQARLLTDGQALCAPSRKGVEGKGCPSSGGGMGEAVTGGGEVGKVNVNTAGINELQKLNGVGQVRASAIVRTREENGFFRTLADLEKVPGMGKAMIQRLSNQITFHDE